MAVLVTAGTGKTSRHLEKLLQEAQIPFVLTSRRGPAAAPDGLAEKTVSFDMLDDTTFNNPFSHKFPNGESITSMYFIGPEVDDPTPSMIAFIDFAVGKGVKRIVMLTGSSTEHGGAWAHMDSLGIEFSVLRATWFNGE